MVGALVRLATFTLQPMEHTATVTGVPCEVKSTVVQVYRTISEGAAPFVYLQ